uniref:Uncharacterized protein n=1 Tax=Anopheles farauti TaxID=69004 RepID=A0A182Q695_9DIPT
MMVFAGTIDGVSNFIFLQQVFALFSSGIILIWNVQIAVRSSVDGVLSATLGSQDVSLVQAKVIDLSCRIGGRLPFDALRSFQHLLLHDHHQMVLSSNHAVIRMSHFVQSDFDPVLIIQPDSLHSIINLKRLAHANDSLFVLYSNKTVRVLKLSTDPNRGDRTRIRHHKYDDHPNLMLSVCTNKSCTIQSIVHDEAKRYGNPNGTNERRADGGTIALKVAELEKGDSDVFAKPKFHHGQQILFFDAHHPEGILKETQFDGSTTIILRERN